MPVPMQSLNFVVGRLWTFHFKRIKKKRKQQTLCKSDAHTTKYYFQWMLYYFEQMSRAHHMCMYCDHCKLHTFTHWHMYSHQVSEREIYCLTKEVHIERYKVNGTQPIPINYILLTHTQTHLNKMFVNT